MFHYPEASKAKKNVTHHCVTRNSVVDGKEVWEISVALSKHTNFAAKWIIPRPLKKPRWCPQCGGTICASFFLDHRVGKHAKYIHSAFAAKSLMKKRRMLIRHIYEVLLHPDGDIYPNLASVIFFAVCPNVSSKSWTVTSRELIVTLKLIDKQRSTS